MSALKINLIQSGSLSIVTGTDSYNVDLGTAVTTTKSLIMFSMKLNSNEIRDYYFTCTFVDSDTINFQRDSSGDTAGTIYWYVIEFSQGITVQHGTYLGLNYPDNITLSTVNTSKSFPIITMRTPGSNLDQGDVVTAEITSSTNLQLDADALGNINADVTWQVAEIDDASVQLLNGTADADGSTSVTITSVTTASTFLFCTFTADDDYYNDDLLRYELTSSTNVDLLRVNSTTTVDCDYMLYVIDIGGDTDINVQRSDHYMNGYLDDDATFTTFDTSKSFPKVNGLFQTWGSVDDANDDAAHGQFLIFIKDSDEVTVERALANSGSTSDYVSLELIEISDQEEDGVYTPYYYENFLKGSMSL